MGLRGPKPGEKKGGRQKGTPNKTTVAVKEAMQAAFDGIGGVPALIEWAQDEKNKGQFYNLYSKLLPLDMNHSGKMEIKTPAIVSLPPKDQRD